MQAFINGEHTNHYWLKKCKQPSLLYIRSGSKNLIFIARICYALFSVTDFFERVPPSPMP
jgi:hypothetical protein